MADGEGWAAFRPSRAAVVLAAVVLAGCTPPGLPAPIAPAPASGVGSVPVGQGAVTIGVDGTVAGFNPHAIADYSLADQAVAELVLPSVSLVAADGTVALNRDVVTRAAVISTHPFTVGYTLDRDAAWSDGTPITAEDFSYLRDQMLVQPGTVDPAGYRLISTIVSRDAGKSVDVAFTRPVADWMTLFSPLLPAHILKDSPGGWTQGLATGIPVSGNRYKMQSYDTVTGEITLVRNDKYWGTPPGPSAAVLRIGRPAALIEALGRGDLQAVLVQPDQADQRSLELTVPAARRVVVPLPGTVQLIFNTTAGATADPNVRLAVAQGLDLTQIGATLSGGNTEAARAAPSLVSLPPAGGSAGGSKAGTGDQARALAALAGAGYRRNSLYMSRNGQILRLTLTYASADQRLAAAARLIQSELAAIGIEIDLQRDEPLAVVDTRLALGAVDLGLVMVPRGTSDGLSIASAFSCPRPATGNAVTNIADQLPRAGNLSGFCSSGAQTMLDQAAGGSIPTALDGVLAAALPVLQISRPLTTFATSASLAPQLASAGPGWSFSGPLSGLAAWPTK